MFDDQVHNRKKDQTDDNLANKIEFFTVFVTDDVTDAGNLWLIGAVLTYTFSKFFCFANANPFLLYLRII
jgi:hypothetical protein